MSVDMRACISGLSVLLNNSDALAVPPRFRLHNAQLGGRNVQRIHIRSQLGVRLFATVGSDQGVDLDAVDVVHLLERDLDLTLVCPSILIRQLSRKKRTERQT